MTAQTAGVPLSSGEQMSLNWKLLIFPQPFVTLQPPIRGASPGEDSPHHISWLTVSFRRCDKKMDTVVLRRRAAVGRREWPRQISRTLCGHDAFRSHVCVYPPTFSCPHHKTVVSSLDFIIKLKPQSSSWFCTANSTFKMTLQTTHPPLPLTLWVQQ